MKNSNLAFAMDAGRQAPTAHQPQRLSLRDGRPAVNARPMRTNAGALRSSGLRLREHDTVQLIGPVVMDRFNVKSRLCDLVDQHLLRYPMPHAVFRDSFGNG